MAICYTSRRKNYLALRVQEEDDELLAAVRNHSESGLRKALKRGADVNCLSSAGLTCLGEVTEAGRLDSVRLLMKAGCDVNKVDFYGQTALQYAAEHGHTGIAQCLIQHGAEVNYMDEGGLGVLHIAVIKRCVDLVRLLIESDASVNMRDVHDLTPLQCAVSGGNMDMVQLLLSSGCSVNAVGPYGRSALYSAAEMARLDLVKALVSRGARVNIQDTYGMTPLCFVCHQGITDVALFLLDAGAKVKVLDKKGNLALHHAVRAGDVAVIKSLLDKGSPTDILNAYFEAPIHLAVRMSNKDIMILLINHGCNVDICEPYGSVTALHIAVNVMNSSSVFAQVLNLLIEGGADLDSLAYTSLESPLYRAVSQDKTEAAKLLIQYGADVNISCPFDVTVLHKACERRNTEVIYYLLHAGIDWTKEKWLQVGIHQSGINTELLHGYDACVPRILIHQPQYVELLHKFEHNPPSLMQLCRIVIRRKLGKKLHVKLLHLPLPLKLTDYLLLKHL